MAGRGDIKAGEAFVRLFLKDDLTRSLKTSLASVTTAAAAAGAALAGAMANYIAVGGQIDDLTARTGASTKQIQEWKFAAEQSGATAEDLEAALRKMAKNGMSPSDFEKLAASIAGIEDPGARAAAAMENFGKSGTKLLPMLRDLTDLKARSDAIGPILDPEDVALADRLGDSFGVLKESLSRLANQVAVAFGPVLQSSLEKAIGVVSMMAQGIKEIREANKFGSGGDWLDKIVELEKSIVSGDWGARGKAATAGGGNFGGRSPDMEIVETKGAEFDMTKSIIEAEKRRMALAREFMTERERFLEKEAQLQRAIAEVQRNKVTGFISPVQASLEKQALETALRRARGAEMERIAKLAPKREAKPVEKIAEALGPQFAVSSATTAAGAFALQSGSANSIAGKSYSELREMKKHLAEISRRQRESEARRERPGIFR